MKRIVSLILIALVGMSLVSCDDHSDCNSPVIISMCDCCASKLKDGVDIELLEDFTYKKRFFAPRYKTINIFGEKIKGKYKETRYTSNYNGVYDVYYAEYEDGSRFSFRINKKTGEIENYYKFSSGTAKTDIGKEEVAKKAEEYAKKYIDDGYVLLKTQNSSIGTYYKYCKYVNGDCITDTVSITVDESGTVVDLEINEIFKDKVPEFNEEKCLKAVNERLSEIIKDGVTSKIVEKRVRRFKNGSYGLQYEI